MNKSDFIDLLSRENNVSIDIATIIVNTVFDSIKETIISGGRVELRGLGCFSVKEYDGYEGRNPKSGEIVTVKAKKRLAFKAGKDISERITIRHSQLT